VPNTSDNSSRVAPVLAGAFDPEGKPWPVAIAVRAGDPALYIAEKGGRVFAIRGGSVDPVPVIDLSREVSHRAEQGLAGLAFSGDRIDPTRSNFGYMVSEFWTNKMWHHRDVAWAISETILMAFLGTMTAALVALPAETLVARFDGPEGEAIGRAHV